MDNVQALGTDAASTVTSDARQYLTFFLADAEYGVDILRVQEIKGWETVTALPNTPAYVQGVMNRRCFRSVDFTYQTDTPNSYRLIKRPITRSCIRSVLEKHSVRRTSRLIRVRRLICLLSIFCVFSLPT
jgi:CheW-like domain